MSRFSRQLAAITLGVVTLATAHAGDATEFALPAGSMFTRAEVQADARRALAAGELRRDEATQRVAAPAQSMLTRDAVRAEVARAAMLPIRGEGRTASLDHVGGM